MKQFFRVRLLQSAVLLLLASFSSFMVMHLAPGGPLAVYARNPRVSAATLALLAHRLGLDQPLWVQYVRWLTGWVQGQWGYSISTGMPVTQMLAAHLAATGSLMLGGLVVASVVGISVGLIGSLHPNSVWDYSTAFVSYAVWAMPVFWLGFVLQLVFGIDLGWLPIAGQSGFSANPGIGDYLVHLILPAITLGAISAAGWSRYLRSSMLEVLRQDYIRTAAAKGVPRRWIVTKHALRNALIPLVTIIALDIPFFFSGAVLTEIVFSWPGVGRLFFNSLQSQDYPVEIAVLMLSTILIILCNLLADIMYALLDPRIQYGH